MVAAVKLSRIPFGFFEKEMFKYFSQFGKVLKLKMFRSKKTGNSRGFAYIQFAYESVAKIVAETMNNYLMFEKLLKCEFIPAAKILPSMFKDWRKSMIPGLGGKKHKALVNSDKDEYHDARARSRLYAKLVKRNKECERLGINYKFRIPEDPRGKPVLKRKAKEMLDGEDNQSKNPDETIQSQPSAYSMLIDSSDDEIELKTPPQAIKKRKSSNDESRLSSDNILEISIKDESSSGDDENEEKAAKKASKAATAAKLSASKRSSQEPTFIKVTSTKLGKTETVSKKVSKKLKKANHTEKTKKFRKMGRYFSAA